MKKYFLLTLMVIYLNASHSQGPWTVGAVALGGFLVKDILNKAAQTAQILETNGEAAANAFLIRAANQMNVAIKNAQILLSGELDKAFDKLDTQEKMLLFQLEKFRQSIEGLKSAAFELKDAIIVDVESVIGNILPWAKQDFLIQRIDGVTQMKRETDYKINILGIGFGTNTGKFESRIKKVVVNSKEIVGFSENKIHSNSSELIINSSQINDAIKLNKPLYARFVVTNEIKRKSGFLVKTWTTHEYEFDFIVTIFPLYAGTVTITYTVPKMDWITTRQNVIYSYQTPNHHQDGDIIAFGWTDYKQVADNQRFVNPHYVTRSGNGCPWTDYSQVVTEDDGRTLKIYGRSWGQSCDYTYAGDIQEFKAVGEDSKTITKDLTFNEALLFEVPTESKYWEIRGKTITLNNFTIIGKSSFSDFLEFQDIIETGTTRKIIYKVNFSNDLK